MLIISEQFHASDRGRQRQGNEDNFFVRSPLFVVADGMGGAQAGEVASQMAVDSFDQGLPDGTPAEGLTQLVEAANRAIHERSQSDAQRAGMGTTVTAAYVGEDDVTIAHVGDSRAYLLRDGDLIRLTRDHSLVGELVERGKLTEEQAETHPQRSVITRALGPEPDVAVDVKAYHARGGDRFLLCSDGLTSMIPEARVKQILEGTEALEEAGRELIAAANDAGGRDNITVLLFRLEEVAAATGSEAGETAEVEAVSEHQGAATMTLPVVSETEAPPKRPAEPIAEAPPPAAEPPRTRRRRRVPGALIALLIVVAIVGAALWTASRAVYFVGVDDESQVVTIYRGLPYDLPFGLELYGTYYPSGVSLAQVPTARRDTFTDHKLRSKDDAEDLVRQLERGDIE